MDRDPSSENLGDRTVEKAQRVQGFFERAVARLRKATREMRTHPSRAARERPMHEGHFEDRDEHWFGRHGRKRMMGPERGYGMYVPRLYRDREPETYRESAREFERDWWRAHTHRGGEERAPRYGGYGGSQYMRDFRDDERPFRRGFEPDSDRDDWDRDERQNRDRRW